MNENEIIITDPVTEEVSQLLDLIILNLFRGIWDVYVLYVGFNPYSFAVKFPLGASSINLHYKYTTHTKSL